MNVKLLRSSFELLKSRAQALVDRFYALLFERHPRVKPLFTHVTMSEQKVKLVQSLAFVVANLERPDALRETLGVMGDRHRGYGVKDEMYDAVGECLLAAMADVAGPAWTPELAAEWTSAYAAVAGVMKAGTSTKVAVDA